MDDLGRLPVFEKLLAFVEQYPAIRKGLYLYGDFNFEDLEKHFAKVKHGNDETWEARRVMERIRYLAEETRLEGVNRR
ncbi:primosomal protein DnaI [Streptococcus pneumoniae]|nr:primosomal protein DnaI [Streptococcus pneumoniae]